MTNNLIKIFIFIVISSLAIYFFTFKQIAIGIGWTILALAAVSIVFIILEWAHREYDNYFKYNIDPKINNFINKFLKKKQ